MSRIQLRSTALIVIDVQESFRQRPYYDATPMPAFFDRCRALVDGFRAIDQPVVRVLHADGDGPFAKASGFVVPMHELDDEADATFEKAAHSALAGTGLQPWLTARGITRLAVCGIRTEQCCETTTRHASDIGFDVDFVSEATMTWPMTTRSGRVVSTGELRERTELVLADRFATVVSVDEAIARAAAARTGAIAA